MSENTPVPANDNTPPEVREKVRELMERSNNEAPDKVLSSEGLEQLQNFLGGTDTGNRKE